jgi:signal peptidase I
MTHTTEAAPSADVPSIPHVPPSRGLVHEVVESVKVIAMGLLFATAVHTIAFQPFTIPSSSMEPGLVIGDYLVVSKFAYGWSRASLPFNPPLPGGRLFGRTAGRGDVVVFRRPSDPKQTWVKRVIGLPGDRVQVSGGVVSVNGTVIPRTPLDVVPDHDMPTRRVLAVRETLADGRTWVTYDGGSGRPGDDTDVFVVPEGQYFMMGDNRDNSLDSRWPADVGVGLLPAGNIVGRAELVVASWTPGGSLYMPWTWLNLQPGRVFRPVR